MLDKKKYYSVTCKCGHVSKRYYIPISFGVIATDGKEAAEKGRNIPRCKHDHKDCVLDVKEITYEEFITLNNKNNMDKYLSCNSIQEQDKLDLSDRLVIDPHFIDEKFEKKETVSLHQVFYKKEKIRKPKKFIKFNYCYEEAYIY